MSKRSEKIRWTPVRKGRQYCSPGCGRGCTHAEYTKALRLGHRLAKRLGPGWKVDVWENVGWHYRARKGNCDVHETIREVGKADYWFNLMSTKQFELHANSIDGGLRALRQLVFRITSGALADLHALDT